MTSLAALPNEILLTIVGYLSHQNDIFSLVKSNRKLYHLLQPYLVRHNVRHHGGSALVGAAKYGRTDFVKELQGLGAYIALFEPEKPWKMDDPTLEKVKNPLLLAVRGNHLETLRALLLQPPPPTLMHAAFHCAIRECRTEFVDLMLHPHAPLGRRALPIPMRASSALVAAVQSNSVAMVERLLRHGARSDPKDRPHAFEAALDAGQGHGLQLELWGLLLANGERLETDWALRKAAANNDKTAIELLVKHGLDISVYGHYDLFNAVMNGHVETAAFLIEMGANPHLRVYCTTHQAYGSTKSAIWYAVHARHLDMIALLVSKDVRPDPEDIVHAQRIGFQEAAVVLLGVPSEPRFAESRVYREEIREHVELAEGLAWEKNRAFKRMGYCHPDLYPLPYPEDCPDDSSFSVMVVGRDKVELGHVSPAGLSRNGFSFESAMKTETLDARGESLRQASWASSDRDSFCENEWNAGIDKVPRDFAQWDQGWIRRNSSNLAGITARRPEREGQGSTGLNESCLLTLIKHQKEGSRLIHLIPLQAMPSTIASGTLYAEFDVHAMRQSAASPLH
ncbi:ankyrin repeat domain-containing protein [Aspergillus mulundensis]|uniref:F-box domain-containing protein n=1 Tax=Aspergillus mulundensis TaxID=1810919 RepID=A0A3D8R3X5_9EURO|nr:hypothetical protein DSM5745_08446 [Aspergillus mulundensis]RDW68686.1 hypothetical protein DSM5745_08446 [Aspergillus mulundensis]